MQFHPFSVTSLVCSGKGGSAGGSEELKEKREESWPLINLQLDVGGGFAFTDAQFHELFLQVVIFKYLNSGLSVPFHLFLPFRKSLANSSSDCGFSPPLLLVLGSTMDLEPGRCRRTDGKKWRCYGNVIPDQKYCERHMFRGSSQRSRKLVEASRNILKSKNDNRENLLPSDKKSRTTAAVSIPNGSFSVPVSTTLNLTPPSVIAADAGKNNSRDESKQNDSSGNRNPRKSSVAAGVSPKSVLQGGGTGTDNGNLSFDTEELRCRRTDGKRWRCSKMVVPSKKYCENHMHRGAKKSASGSTAAALTVVASGSCMRKSEMVKKSCRVLDTNLSISVAVNPWQVFDGDSTTTSSSSSDATTVSDENVYQFLNTF